MSTMVRAPVRIRRDGGFGDHPDFTHHFAALMRKAGRKIYSFDLLPMTGRYACWALNERGLRSFFPGATNIQPYSD
jgi:hypothetical protein